MSISVLRVIALFSVAVSALAATFPVTFQGSTQTQISVSYVATTTAACTIGAVDQNSGPTVSDLDTAKFANANSDINRTAANGFRWPSLCGGLACSATNADVHRQVFIGGHDEIKLGTDGKYYSTALQVNSGHAVTVTCNSGADIGTVAASTGNLPLASNYPEMPIPTPGSPLGGIPQPTVDWSRAGRSKTYTDPMTGVLIQRITGGNDFMNDSGAVVPGAFQTPVLDVNGGAWTNKANFTTNQVAGTLATTTTINAPIFAAFTNAFIPSGFSRWTDFLITPYGSANSNSIIATWCISLDSGQTCANYAPIDVAYSTTPQCQPAGNCANSIPANTPGSFFDGWGQMKTAFGTEDFLNRAITNASASGNAVTIASPDGAQGIRRFYMGLVPGSKFQLTSCAVGSDTVLTVASVNNQGSITTVESGLTLTTCLYTDMHAGIRAVMKNAGTLNLSFQASGFSSREYNGGTSGSHYNCAKTKVTDITTDCDGADHTGAPLSGYLCQMSTGGNNSVFLIQDNGRMCLQSNLYSPTAPQHLSVNTIPIWTDNRTVVGTDQQTPKHVWTAVHAAGNYQEMAVDVHPIPDVVDTRMSYFDQGPATPSSAQIIALGGPAAAAVSSGIWPPFGLETVTEDKNGNPIVQYNSQLGDGQLCMKAFTDIAGTAISTMPAYGSYPLSTTACHASPNSGGGYIFVGTSGSDNRLAPVQFSSSTVLGGPFAANVIGVRKNGSWIQTSLTIPTCTKASAAVCTSTGHNLSSVTHYTSGNTQGDFMTISGATGAGWVTGLNAPLYARADQTTDNNTFSLYTDPRGLVPLDSTGFGTLGGTITASLSRPIYSLLISGVTGTTTARVAISTVDGGTLQRYPTIGTTGITNIMFDADPITIIAAYLNSTTQYYAKVSCAGCATNQFDLYSDPDLAPGHAVSVASLGTVTNFYVLYAERCPDPATITLPGPMYTDTGFGTTGAGNQKIRCVGIRLASEPESNFPGTNEHTKYPPPPSSTEYTDVNKSMLHQIAVGDGFTDLAHATQAHEILYALSVDRSVSENQIDVVVERTYGDNPLFKWRGDQHGPLTDSYSNQHSPGWTATASGIINQVLLEPSTMPESFFAPPVNLSHFDIVTGSSAGLITNAGNYKNAGITDDVVDASISTYLNASATNHDSNPVWNADTTYNWFGLGQSYPAKRNIYSQTPAAERIWKGDWAAPNIDNGTGKNALDGTAFMRTLTNVSGIVWKIQSLSPINIKVSPIFASSFPYNYYTDKSGPGAWSQANGTMCYPYAANECVSGTSAGDQYIYLASTTLQTVGPSGQQCFSNDATIGAPCAFGLWSGMGWALQIRQSPTDTNATGMRRLTQGFWPGMGQYYASNWISSPEGKWGFFASNPIGQRPKNGESGADFFAMKLPPWPTIADNVTRTAYVPLRLSFSGISGDFIRVTWWHGETTPYCTSRAEACWTTSSPSTSSPFLFAGETQAKTSCSSGCTIPIPAIPGRVLFYQAERTNGSVIALGLIQTAFVK